MKFYKFILTAIVFLLNTFTSSAQSAIPTDEITDSTAVLSDSAYIAVLLDSLKLSQMNEAHARMELEMFKFELASADSVQRHQQIQRIDSLRAVTPGIPVIVEGDTLFLFYARRGGYSAMTRALMASEMITRIGNKLVIYPDSVYIDNSDNISDIMYGSDVIASFTDQDALWAGVPQDSLARISRQAVVDELHKLKEEHGWWRLVKRVFYLLLIIVGQWILFKVTIILFRSVYRKIEGLRDTKLHPLMIQNYELLDTGRQVSLLLFGARLAKYLLMALQLVVSVPLVFSIFPQTENFAMDLLGYIWIPVKSIFWGVINYIPNLFTIFIIWLAIRYLIRLLKFFSHEIATERLRIPGFYADWALPTYNIIRFLLYAFMIAMIYPYLPGSDKGVFQGISVFVGLIISLGSSTVIGNVIAGWVITYMRPFKKGDRIKVNDTIGDIIEKTPLVTRIRTPKNEIVTVPNSFIMSSQSINYTTSARDYGLILHAEVTIGYDVPWRLVHRMLIDAALNTKGIESNPHPFVLETGLNDWYPVYQINAYTKESHRMAQIYSELYQNIQDRFNEEGVEIMSPTYIATRDGNASTVVTDPMK